MFKLIGVALAALCLGSAAASAQKNVLVIVADDIGLGDVSGYGVGQDPPRTPNLDVLAEQGVTFTNAWTYPFCSPTRAAILTGRYGYRTGIGHLVNPHNFDAALRIAEVTLPEMLEQGTGGAYASAAFGKWHVGNLSNGGDLAPNVAGFPYYKGILAGANDQYFDHDSVENGETLPQPGYLTSTTVDDVLAWTSGVSDQPWFVYLAFHAPHTPLHAPPTELHTNPALVPGSVPDPQADDKRAYFKAMVEAMDTEIGNLFEGLGDAMQDTTVIFLGDNGALGQIIAAPYVKEQAKSTLYEGGVNVPFIVSDPDVVMPGRKSHTLVHAVDVFATVAEAAGVDLATSHPDLTLDSQSVMPFVDFKTLPVPRVALYTEHFSPNTKIGPHEYYRRTARDRRYKLLQLDAGEHLFDLQVDPYESNDLLLGQLNLDEQRAYNRLLDVIEAHAADAEAEAEAEQESAAGE